MDIQRMQRFAPEFDMAARATYARATINGIRRRSRTASRSGSGKLAGGDTGDLMLLMGWSSEEMPRRYGASAAAERAQQVDARLGTGERVYRVRPPAESTRPALNVSYCLSMLGGLVGLQAHPRQQRVQEALGTGTRSRSTSN